MANKLNVLESYFEKFSTTTVIRVFNFIRTAPFLIERIFWILVFLGFTCVTVWDISQTIQKFLSEPTASIVSFPETRDGLNFSNATLCVDVNKDSLLKLYDNETVLDAIMKAFAFTPDIVQHFRKKLAIFHFTYDELSQKYSLSNESFAADAISPFYDELGAKGSSMFDENDVAFLGLTAAMLESLVGAEYGARQPNASNAVFTTGTLEKLYEFYASRRTDFVQLLHLTVEATCVLQQIRLYVFRRSAKTALWTQTIFNVCKGPLELKWFGKTDDSELACYRLPSDALVFYTVFDTVVLTAKIEALYGELSASVGCGLESLSIDLAGTMSTQAGQAPLLAKLNQKQSARISVETWSTSANLRRSGCLDRSVQGVAYECVTWCRAKLIMEACGCVPLINEFTGKFKPPRGTLENCACSQCKNLAYGKAIASNLRCGDAFAASDDESKANCSRRCYKNCDVILYSNVVRPYGADGDNHTSNFGDLDATTVVELGSDRTVYMRVVEFKTMDEKQLIVSLGGNLSLYLGASFLALIHIIVFFVKLPFDIAAGRDTTAQTAAPQAPSVNLSRSDSHVGESKIDETFALVFAQQVNFRRQVRHVNRRLDRMSMQIEAILTLINGRR